MWYETPNVAQYSQFVEPLPEYHHLNRLVDSVELYKMLVAGDGERFDRHFETMLAQMAEPDFGVEAQPLSRIEADNGGPLSYARSESNRFPRTFDVLRDMARAAGREAFVETIMSPSARQLPPTERPGVTVDHLAQQIPELREQFGSEHFMQFGAFIDAELLEELSQQVERAPFRGLFHDPLGVDYSMDFGPTQAVLHYLVTDRRIIDILELVTRLQPGTLNRFSGRVYRMIPSRDRDGYHNDVHLQDRRLMAISVSMTQTACDGGLLHLKRKGWRRPFLMSKPAALGEAIVFRISRWLMHKAGDVYGGTRTNLAGWFCAREGFDYERWLDTPCFEDDGRTLRTLHRRLLQVR